MTAGAHSAVLEREASCIPGGILKHNNLFSMNNGEYLLIPNSKEIVSKPTLFARLPSSLHGQYLYVLYGSEGPEQHTNEQPVYCELNYFLVTISKFKMDPVR